MRNNIGSGTPRRESTNTASCDRARSFLSRIPESIPQFPNSPSRVFFTLLSCVSTWVEAGAGAGAKAQFDPGGFAAMNVHLTAMLPIPDIAMPPGKIIFATNVNDQGILQEIVQIRRYATTVVFLATWLLNATQRLCVGTARVQDISQTNAPTTQSAICVARQVTWRVTARLQALQPMTQGFATTVTSQATSLLSARTRRLATTAVNPVTSLAIALTSLSATSAIYRVMLPDSAPSRAI